MNPLDVKIGDFVTYSFVGKDGVLLTRPAVVVGMATPGLPNLTIFTDGANDTETGGPAAVLRKSAVEYSADPADLKWSPGLSYRVTLLETAAAPKE
jgi:hypothetical protein